MKKSTKLTIILVLCILLFAAMVVIMVYMMGRPNENIVLPEFDTSAKSISTLVQKPDGYQEFNDESIPFKCSLVPQPVVSEDGRSVSIYFTNSEENEDWLMVQIETDYNQVSAKSGLIKPGEYIEKVYFQEDLEKGFTPGETVRIRVMSYKPELYYSHGTFVMKTELK